MTDRTNAELENDIAAIRRVIEERELQPLVAINALLADESVVNVIEAISEALPLLTGERHQQATNIVQVLTHAPAFLTAQAAAIAARLEPAPEPVTPPAE